MSTRVETEAKVWIYEVDSEESDPREQQIVVRTHRNDEDRVILQVNGSKPVTVIVGDLLTAIKRCSR